MDYAGAAEALGAAYVEDPVEFGTEADLRRRLVDHLEDRLAAADALEATVEDPRLVGGSPSYKREYRDEIESRLRDRGRVGRIRLGVSLDKGQRYDVGVFRESLAHPVEWVRRGSKRFDERDLAAVFEVKYIKNKCYPPTECPITSDALLDCSIDELRTAVNTDENRLEGDLEQLRSLPADVETVFVLVSNNNYLFAEPLVEGERDERRKQRAGRAMREWLADAASDTAVYYVQPMGATWITE